ncbi:MAG: hypothetical protein MUC85_04850 [Anaerolineales bacterium]|nr:hypothetical protein [Anaerolineales bacterium]
MKFQGLYIKLWVIFISLAALLAQPLEGMAKRSPAPANRPVQPAAATLNGWKYTVVTQDSDLGVVSVSDDGELLMVQRDGIEYNLLRWKNGVFSQVSLPEGVQFYSGGYLKPNGEIAFNGYCGSSTITACLRKSDGSVVIVNTGEGYSDFNFTNNGWWLLDSYLGNGVRRVWATDGYTQTQSADVILNDYGIPSAVRFIVGMGPDGAVVVMEQVWDGVEKFSRLRYVGARNEILVERFYDQLNFRGDTILGGRVGVNEAGDILYEQEYMSGWGGVSIQSLRIRLANGSDTEQINSNSGYDSYSLPMKLGASLRPLFRARDISTYEPDRVETPQDISYYIAGFNPPGDIFTIPVGDLLGETSYYFASDPLPSPNMDYIVSHVQLGSGGQAIVLAGDVQRLPVIILPGIAGSYAADQDDDYTWLMNRGVHPDGLVVDPLGGFYDDLTLTFEALGYVQGKDLFVANYDWRLPPGPLDGAIDGHVDGLSGAGVSDEIFLYGVDYLGYYLRQAAQAWELTHGEPLEKVHIIAHSTGGLVARTYIQSDAYGALYDDSHALPTVAHFIMIGVPNRGASKPYNPLQDNWIADPAYQKLLSKIVNRAYIKVIAGQTISGPDYDIALSDLLDEFGKPDPVKFVEMYVPTLRSLLATYDFFSDGGAYHDLNETAERNTWVLDLNNGLDLNDVPPADPNAFADLCMLTVIYGTSQNTKWLTRQLNGPAEDVLSPFTDFLSSDAAVGEKYFLDIAGVKNGDGTVPTLSAAGQFLGDERVTLLPMIQGENTNFPADHTALVGNLDVQRAILNRLGISHTLGDVHLGAGANLGSVLSVISDPVEIVLEDGLGRRLGYTNATGKLEEIPGSQWFGAAEGSGWLLGEVVLPLQVTLTGLGEAYYVQIAVKTPLFQGGWSSAGTLGIGETLTGLVEIESNSHLVFVPLLLRP